MFETLGIFNYQGFILATIAIILLPGPNSLYVLSVAGRYGIKSGYIGALGIFLGDSILMLITALGAASILKANPMLFNVLKYAGAFYLAFIGVKILINLVKQNKNSKQNIEHDLSEDKLINQAINSNINNKNYFKTALYISLINPKAILFFLAFFVQFINPNPTIWQPFIILGITLQIISFIYLSIVIFAGKYFAKYFQQHSFLKYSGSVSIGLLFIFFAYKLFSSGL